MRIKRVLVVLKKSFTEYYRGVKNLPARFKESQRAHNLAKKKVIGTLRRYHIQFDTIQRDDLAIRLIKEYDLVIGVGGDGTLFDISHYTLKTPVLLVNSDLGRSMGLFSGADGDSFPWSLEAILQDRLPVTHLHRLKASINGIRIKELVLNDILFCHQIPAVMSKYILKVGKDQEHQKSSGVWISTASGSTAAICSAGGEILPIGSKAMQLFVREPYQWGMAPYRLTRCVTHLPTYLTSLMDKAAIYIDGARVVYRLSFGDRVKIEPGAPPIRILGYRPELRDALASRYISPPRV